MSGNRNDDYDRKLKRHLAAWAPDSEDFGIGETSPLYGFKEWSAEDQEAVKQWLKDQAARDAATAKANPFGPPSVAAPRSKNRLGKPLARR